MSHRTIITPVALVILLILAPASPSSRAVFRSQQAQQTQTAVAGPITIPFELALRHIIVKVRVDNSRPLSFVLDTGDQFAIIDYARAKELGLKLAGQVRVGGAGGGTQLGAFVTGSSFTLEGLDNFSQPVNLAFPVGNMSPRFGQDFDGIIGSEFIKKFVVEVDYLARVLRLHDRKTFVYQGSGEAIPVKLNGAGHPIITAEVTPLGGSPVKGRFVVDIGSSLALALYSPFVTEHGLLNPPLKTIRALGGAGAGGETVGRLGRVSELKIGKYVVSKPITMFSEDKAGAFATKEVLGNIGAQVMNRFRVWLDYERDRIIFEPNANFGKPYDRAFSGLTIRADGQDYRTFRITHVLEDSPASEIGLKENDIITAVDNTAAATIDLTKLNEMFEREVTYQLSVQRGTETLSLKLKPRRLV